MPAGAIPTLAGILIFPLSGSRMHKPDEQMGSTRTRRQIPSEYTNDGFTGNGYFFLSNKGLLYDLHFLNDDDLEKFKFLYQQYTDRIKDGGKTEGEFVKILASQSDLLKYLNRLTNTPGNQTDQIPRDLPTRKNQDGRHNRRLKRLRHIRRLNKNIIRDVKSAVPRNIHDRVIY